MLHHWELPQNLRGIHLQHALINLSPAVLDTGNIVQHWRVLPERAALDVVDELDGGEVHVHVFVFGNGIFVGYFGW